VRPKYAVTPLDGIKEAAGAQVKVAYSPGAVMPGEEAAGEAPPNPAQLRSDAVELARQADAAVVVVGYSFKLEGEGFDRASMDLPAAQDELIEAIAAANKNTIVVVASGAPVTMTKWIGRVPAVMQAWYGGQEAGHAIGDILFGAQNPSGKLPVTFPRQWSDSPGYSDYPGVDLHTAYSEGIYVGYRGFDKGTVEPLFPFGYGLSYTRFDYSDLKISPSKAAAGEPVEVAMQVRNSGSRAGAEVVQLYLHDVKSSIDRPLKELKGFQRVTLKPGEARTLKFTLDQAAMSFFSTAKDEWMAVPGDFEVWIGASSRDIRLQGSFELTQ
jgi:beta-glucosidase